MVGIVFVATLNHAFASFAVHVLIFQKIPQYLHAPPAIYVLGKKGRHTQ